MTKPKRRLSLKLTAAVATLLFIVAWYFGARRVMALNIELGMNRTEVIKVLGEPTEFGLSFDSRGNTDIWERVVIGRSVYAQYIIVDFNAESKVCQLQVAIRFLGYHSIVIRP